MCIYIYIFAHKSSNGPRFLPSKAHFQVLLGDVLPQIKKKGSKFVGLLVQAKHASKFVAPPEVRKSLEIRSKCLRFLDPGDSVLLIGTVDGKWMILAALRFWGNIRIPDDKFNDFHHLHRASKEEYNALKSKWAKQEDFCWGWQFELADELTQPLHIESKKGCEVWVHLSQEDWGCA